MKKSKIIVVGCGARGMTYSDQMIDKYPEDFEVVAVAEPVKDRREYMKRKHSLPDEMCFESWEELLAMPKFADVVVIATQDRDHFAPTMAAIANGYNLLLEKPVSPTPEQCRKIQYAAEEKGVFVLICHVLRFTPFFTALKDIIDSGEIGQVMNIQHTEGVGNVHQSHSFVRGNWSNEQQSSFMLLQKSCHDMDILAWLIGKKCKAVQSFGSLSYFRPENAPKGSPERCIEGCPVQKTCPYDSVKLYLECHPSSWFRTAATKLVNPTNDDVLHALKTTQYGKCVYKCNNNVVDHQIVNLQFEDDVYASFTMSAFNRGGRTIRIMGTKGEINAEMSNPIISIYNFDTQSFREYDSNGSTVESIVGGHGGGDFGIIFALKNLLNGQRNKSVCDIKESCDNHMIAFAAEQSRKNGGQVVYIDDYCKELEERLQVNG